MKVYIAGQITGDHGYKARFQTAQDFFEEQGDVVLNPAQLPEGMSPADYMSICIPMIYAADLVAFLPNYGSSRGANLEFALCEYISKQSAFLEQWPAFMEKWNEKSV